MQRCPLRHLLCYKSALTAMVKVLLLSHTGWKAAQHHPEQGITGQRMRVSELLRLCGLGFCAQRIWYGRRLFTQQEKQIKDETPNPHSGACPLLIIPLSNLVIKANSNCVSATPAACFYCNQCISLGSCCLPVASSSTAKTLSTLGLVCWGFCRGCQMEGTRVSALDTGEKKLLGWFFPCLIHPLIFF